MWTEATERRWQQEAELVMTGMMEWRLQHTRASLKEIEDVLDERWAKMRARMVQDLALKSAATRITEASEAERPTCPPCGGSLETRGEQERTLTTTHNQSIRLVRSYAICPASGTGHFPLDEELQLLPGPFTPSLIESIVRLATWRPFVPVTKAIAFFYHVSVSEPTARRKTETAGAA